jgi:4-amino-4-deoxy-L-arabinose transferase-like glycosyltransferase
MSTVAIKRYDLLAAFFCLGILVTALVIGRFHQVGTFGVETDFYGSYATQAQDILAGQPYTYQHNPPGYVLVLAAVSLITRDFFLAGKIISAFAAALLGWITYLLFKALFDRRIALASTALLLVAVLPFSFLAASDLLAAAIIMLSVWVVLRRPVLTFNACFFAGIFAGAAYLIRSPAIFVILGVGFSLLFLNLNNERFGICLARAGVYLCGIFLITSPWLLINWQRNGSPFASSAYLQIAAHFYDPQADAYGTSMTQAAARFQSLSDVLLHDPPRVLSIYLKDVLYGNPARLVTGGIGFPAFLFAGAGFLFLARDLSRRRVTFFIVCVLGYLLSALVGFQIRYYFFLFPLLFVSIAYFLFHDRILAQAGQTPLSNVTISWLIVMILAVFGLRQAHKATTQTIASEPRYLLEIADFLKHRSSARELIITRKPHIAFLSGLKDDFPLAETADEYLAKARETGARYIVYTQSDASLWPGLRSFSNPELLSKAFKVIYRHEPTQTLIYEIEIKNF